MLSKVAMAEFGEDGDPPPLHPGDADVPGAGKASCEGSVLNGDCGISDNMVCSGSLAAAAAGGQAAGSAADAFAGSDAKCEIPRRSSIIKVNIEVTVSRP